jgi:hypothetical protein
MKKFSSLMISILVLTGPALGEHSEANIRLLETLYKGASAESSQPTSRYSQKSSGEHASGGGVQWNASSHCLPAELKEVVRDVADKFGPVRVNSTGRSWSHNRAVGGATQSYHLSCQAVDFRVFASNTGAVASYLRSHGGGVKHYGGGLFHIDKGSARTW